MEMPFISRGDSLNRGHYNRISLGPETHREHEKKDVVSVSPMHLHHVISRS